MSVLLALTAGLAGLAFVTAGVFSILTLFWGDLLEPERPAPTAGELTKAA